MIGYILLFAFIAALGFWYCLCRGHLQIDAYDGNTAAKILGEEEDSHD